MNKEFLKLVVPNLLSNLTVPLVSLVDVAIMGHMPNQFHIVAIGFGVTLFNFLYWSFGFLRMGSTGLIAQAYGSGDDRFLALTTIRSYSIAILIGVFFILFQDLVLYISLLIIQPTNEISELLQDYFKWRIWAAPATLISYVTIGWFIGFQKSKWVLYYTLLVNVSNVAFSLFFTRFFDLGIVGVAMGTLVAQYLGLLFGLYLILPKIHISLHIRAAFTNRTEWFLLLKANSNIFIRTLVLIFVLSYFKIEAGKADGLIGPANILLLEFVTIGAFFIDGVAYAAEALTGKYLGKGLKTLFNRALKLSFVWGFFISLILSLVFYFADTLILSSLTEHLDLIDIAEAYSFWLVLFPLIAIWAFIWDGIFIGVSASSGMRNSMLFSGLAFICAIFFIDSRFGNHSMWLALLIFMAARGLYQSLDYNLRIKHRLKFIA